MSQLDFASHSIQYKTPAPQLVFPTTQGPMSSTYAELIADLTRDIQRAQPRDALQFCANWFNARLQEQRTRVRDAFQAQAFGRPSAAAGLTDELFVDRTLQPRASVNNLGSMSMASSAASVRSSPMPSHSQPHPHPQPQPIPQPVPQQAQPHAPQPNPFALSAGSAFSLIPGTRLADPFAPSASPRPRPNHRALTPQQRHTVIHEEEEPPSPGSPTDSGPSSSAQFLAPPPSALGRRVSVSAESITPSASGALPPTPNYPKTPEQLQRIKASIANAFLFRNLDAEQERAVLGAMQERSVASGECVIEQGADGDYFYVVESGSLDCYVKRAGEDSNGVSVGEETHPVYGRKVLTYTTGGTFGELALMYNAPRAATIVAIEPSTLWALDRMSFRSIILSVANRKRKMYERFLATVPLLETLDASERSRIADVLEPRTYNEGESVVEEGETGNEFFIIESGEATAFKRVKGEDGELRDDVVMKYGAGDFFGELALLHRAPRAATVRASVRPADSSEPANKLKVAVLDAQAFTRLLGNLKSLLDRHASQNYGASYRRN
ncbi:cAMP-dependent protein kinase inhibitor [Ceratobasidium sp. AG-Ba]|nr:cAMP-dependent protein kinase inhibitor [Ceratobasidium sp. AG-Ba]